MFPLSILLFIHYWTTSRYKLFSKDFFFDDFVEIEVLIFDLATISFITHIQSIFFISEITKNIVNNQING